MNLKTTLGNTPLHFAVLRGSSDLAMLLMEQGADLTIENDESYTPMCIAVIGGHVE